MDESNIAENEELGIQEIIDQSKCSKHHYNLQDCYFQHRDWRKCTSEMEMFRTCMAQKNNTDEGVKSDEINECEGCKESLMGHRYVMVKEKPFHVKCYESSFANECQLCKEKILVDDKNITSNDMNWHGKCFNCSNCNSFLLKNPFLVKDESLFCEECYEDKFADRCDECTKPFKRDTNKYEFEDKKYHESCFLCKICNKPISDTPFIKHAEHGCICESCHSANYGIYCTSCKKVIVSDGIEYEEKPYHSQCLTCKICECALFGTKFTKHDEKMYCKNCYIEHFAKKCSICDKFIDDLEGSQYVSFDNKQWHPECFKCGKCTETLVDQPFSIKEGQLNCKNCTALVEK